MKRALPSATWLALLAVTFGCATYSPKPLVPSAALERFEARTLAAPSLERFVIESTAAEPMLWPPAAWDLHLLTLAALHFHADLDLARAKFGVANAGTITAGQRPNPSLGFLAQRDTPAVAGLSPWALRPTISVPIETAGKRDHRLVLARHQTDAEWLSVLASAWKVRSRLRSALLDRLFAEQELELLETEEAVRGEIVAVLEVRLGAGDLPPQLLTDARLQLSRIRQLRQLGKGRLDETDAALADSLGLPITAIDGIRLVFPTADVLPPEAAIGDVLRRRAMLGRVDLLRALLEYAVAEDALQLEVARQYPDLEITPGYQWSEPQRTWRLGFSLVLPLFNQNEGPIAEAEARRELAAAAFGALQSSIVGELNTRAARYRGAIQSYALAAELLAAAEARQRKVEEAAQAGDVDRGAVLDARLEVVAARRDLAAASRSAQAALGAMEDAVQWPLDGSPPLPDIPEKSDRASSRPTSMQEEEP